MLDNLDVKNKFNNPRFGSATASPFGMNTALNNTAPSMQADIDVQKIKEAGTDSYLGKRLTSYSDVDPMLQYAVALPTWVLINQAFDRTAKFCRGNYNQTIIYKIGNFGDKVSDFFTQNPVARFINSGIDNVKGVWNKVIYKNSALIRAFNKTPSVPELALVKPSMDGLKGMIAHDCAQVWDGFLEPMKCAKDFDSLGATKQQIAQIEKAVGRAVSAEERALLLQVEEFRFLNPDKTAKTVRAFQNAKPEVRAKYLKELKLKVMGFKDLAEFEMIKKEPVKNLDRVLEILQKPGNKLFARINYSNKNAGTIAKGELLGRKVYFSEVYNKLLASLGNSNFKHKTALGRTLTKISGLIVEGATSRAAGGKLAAGMQAIFLAEALIRASRQETTGDKIKSFAERFAECIGFFVFMAPSIKLMHKIGGLQYSGMSQAQIETYRNAVIEFNKKVMNCEFQNKKEYKAAKNILKSQFRPKTRNPFVWFARKSADILTVGLEQVRPYTKHKVKKVDMNIMGIISKSWWKNIPHRLKDVMFNPKYWFKQVAGYPVRFLVPMMIFIPFFNKFLIKGSHMIFGRPKESLLDKEPEETESGANQVQPQVNMNTQNQIRPGTVIANPSLTQVSQSPTNLLNKYKTTPTSGTAQISHTGSPNLKSDKPLNAEPAKNSEENTQPEPKSRYIPSPEGVKIKENQQSLSEIDKALKRADQIEKLAIDTLGI